MSFEIIRLMRLLAALAIFASSSLFAAEGENAPMGKDLVDVARSEFEKENYAGAHAALDQFEKAKGSSVESHDLRGRINMEQGNFSGAAQAFEAAHKADPAIFAPRLHGGDLLLRQKQYAKAREVYQTLLKETNILFSSERLRYAILLTYLGEHDEKAAKEALERIPFPTQSPAYYYAEAAWAFAHGKPRGGRKWLKNADKIYPSDVTSWFARPLYDFGWLKDKPPLSANSPT